MAKLSVVPQKIFGATGGTGEFGAFGSDSVGTPVTTKNLETIQSLAPYLQGWFAATDNANEPPRIQDMNGLFFLITSQLGYLFQNGVPEWHEDNEYYATVSYCQKGGVIYRSRTGIDGSPNVNNDPATDDGTNWESGEASYRQLKFDLDRLGFSGYALYTDRYLQHKRDIAMRMRVGDSIISSVSHTPTAFSAAQSSANPTNPEYFPAIPRHDADHDISTAQVPQWVIDELNAEKITFGAVSSFSATLASGVLTFGLGSDSDKLLALINEMGLVNRWYGSSEAANYGSLGALHTGARQYCVTIAGVNYAITACSIGLRTITLATAPSDGTVTIEVYPNRIAGSTTSSRLRRISGEAIVAAGDVTGEVVVGGSRMGKILGHFHVPLSPITTTFSGIVSGSGGMFAAGSTNHAESATTGSPTTDGTNTLVTGKSNDPRTAGMAVYTFLAVVLATNWT